MVLQSNSAITYKVSKSAILQIVATSLSSAKSHVASINWLEKNFIHNIAIVYVKTSNSYPLLKYSKMSNEIETVHDGGEALSENARKLVNLIVKIMVNKTFRDFEEQNDGKVDANSPNNNKGEWESNTASDTTT